MAEEKLYTPREAAALVGLSYDRFRHRRDYMNLALVVLSEKPPHGNRYRFTQSAVDEIIAMRSFRPQVFDDATK